MEIISGTKTDLACSQTKKWMQVNVMLLQKGKYHSSVR